MSDTAAIILHEFGAQAHGMRQCTVEIAAKGFVAFHTIRPFPKEETLDGVFTGLYTYVHVVLVHRQMNMPNWYSTTGRFIIRETQRRTVCWTTSGPFRHLLASRDSAAIAHRC